MTDEIVLKATVRTERRSNGSGRLRRAGFIPGVISRLKGDATLIQLDAHDYMMTMRKHHADQLLVSVELDGTKIPALLREVQYHVISGNAIHVDLGEIDLKKVVRVDTPIRLIGEADGVKNGGGVLEQATRMIHVDCLPTDIVEEFDVDVSSLKVGDTLTVANLDFGPKYHITTPKDTLIATVVAPDAEEAVEASAEAAPEVIAKGKTDAAAAPAKK